MLNKNDIDDLRKKMIISLEILQKYNYLINSYGLDFFVENHWQKLPVSWQLCLQKGIPFESFAFLLDWEDENIRNRDTLWPLSLLTLRTLFRHLCLKRRQLTKDIVQPSILRHTKLKFMFIKGIKLKKSHELKYMADMCKEIYEKLPVDFIVDFGSGLGHLARLLGFGYGMRMCCLEKDKSLIYQAESADDCMMKLIKKHIANTKWDEYKKPVHINIHLNDKISLDNILSIIQSAMNLKNGDFTFGIIGLHPCGDLGVTLVNLFLNCQQATFCNLVGCCYMKLSTKNTTVKESPQQYGYPLSKYMRKLADFYHLSNEAREVACHAIELYRDRLKIKDCDYLKVHCFRAVTEYILVKHFPNLKHTALKNVKYSDNMSFKEVTMGTPAASLPEHVLATPVIHQYLSTWPHVVTFYTLRLFFAPLIESVILYDRLLYLLENGTSREWHRYTLRYI